MAVARIGDDRTAPPGSPLRLRNGVARRAGMEWRAARRSFVAPRGMGASRAGEESFAGPLREDDRGEAGLRSDTPHRAREWSAADLGNGWRSMPGRFRTAFQLHRLHSEAIRCHSKPRTPSSQKPRGSFRVRK
ncbi:hypothetical protein REMIM1_PC00232 (plasmid) [Rhizobium etli bv. mimosae str. Mim1]|nr:hypothetical protein REMIM1_PC00232 [Rhizobium etli bv. mimosae str. Mim1]